MVAQDDEHQIVVAVVLHEGDQGVQRVLDRPAVRRADPRAVAVERGPCHRVHRHALEDRAVADGVPADQPGDAGPWRVARHEIDLREDGTAVGTCELEPLQGQEDVLVGHGGVRVPRAAIPDVTPVVELVVVVERRSFRPRPVVRRHVTDGSPPGPLERLAEREAIARDELVVAQLVVDPDTRLQGRVRQPADAAERRRGEEGAPGAEAGGLQPLGPPVEHGVDLWRERGVLNRDLAVALDEHEEHVLAAQARQQPAAGRVAEAVVADLLAEDRVVLDAGLHRTDLVEDEAGGARGCDRSAERPAERPHDAERRDGRERPPAVAGSDPGQAKQGQGREHEHGDAEHRRSGDEQVRLRPADRVAQRLDGDAGVAPVGNRIERPVEGLEEPHVEDLHDDQQTEKRAGDTGQEAPRGGGQDESQGDRDEALEREAHERAGRETTQVVRSDEGDPHDQDGEDREHGSDARAHASASWAGGSGDSAPEVAVRSRRHSTVRGVPAAPQPPHVAAERLGEQGERCDEGGLGQSPRQDVRRRERQHDPLRRGDDLAPVARRQLRPHPRQQPAGGEERVARGADREHPRAGRAGGIHAEDEDQERVDLAVEVRAQRRRRPCAPHDPSVDGVQRERDDRECHQHRDRRGPAERVRDQRRDADGERGPGKGHPVGRAQPVAAMAGETARQRRVRDHSARRSGDPGGAAEADGPRERGEQQHLRDQSRHRAGLQRSQPLACHRAGLDRSHRSSAFVGTWGSTGDTAVRFSGAAGTVRPRVVNGCRVERR